MFKMNTEHSMNNCCHAPAIHGFLHLQQLMNPDSATPSKGFVFITVNCCTRFSALLRCGADDLPAGNEVLCQEKPFLYPENF